MMIARNYLIVSLAVLGCLLAWPAAAEWSHDPTENNPVSTEPNAQTSPQLAGDGEGRMFMVWQHHVGAVHEDCNIHIQRFDSDGNEMWPSGGVPVCTVAGFQADPQVISDGAGGAIIVWTDNRAGSLDWNIYAQRMGPGGQRLWAVEGVSLCTAAENQEWQRIVSDGAGGAIVVWNDSRWLNHDIWAQRIDANGNTLWAVDGEMVCVDPEEQRGALVTSDGTGGVIVCWTDYRSPDPLGEAYVQRMTANGIVVWAPDGVNVSNASSTQRPTGMVQDGSGGAIIVWKDSRNYTAGIFDAYAQRVDTNGSVLWSASGTPVCTTETGQFEPRLVSDGAGGALFCWFEWWDSTNHHVRAQRLDGSGGILWSPAGEVVSDADTGYDYLKMVSDGAGGAIIGWVDRRAGSEDVRAQRVNGDGAMLWAIDGQDICAAVYHQYDPEMVSDGAGGAVIIWKDERNTDEYYYNIDIFAQQVDADGLLGGPENQPPVALADVAPTSGTEPLTVSFNAGDSYDPEGMSLAYDWDFGDGSPHSTAMITSHLYTGPGNYQALLTVTDDQLLTDTYPVTISVDAVINEPPVAVAQASPPSGYAPHTVGFGASNSYDPDGTPLDYFWDFGDPGSSSNTSDQENPTHVYLNQGTYTAWLTVSDGDLTDSAPVTVQVMRALSAEMMCWPQIGVLPFDCQVTGTLNNEYSSYHRRLAATVTVYLPNGEHFTNYKRGYTNLAPSSSHQFSWTEHLSSIEMIGAIHAQLFVQDVTPTPYNQPPYPSSGATASSGCLVEVLAD